MIELTNAKQWKYELVFDYINRWHALSLECKDRLSDASAVEMCTKGMAWDLLYLLQVRKSQTFQELATKAHDMEVTIASHRCSSLSFAESKRYRTKVKKNVKFSKNSAKETTTVTKAEPIRITEKLGRTADPKYCRYHWMVRHPLKKCITIKERIMQLAKEGRIILDLDDVVEANHVSS